MQQLCQGGPVVHRSQSQIKKIQKSYCKKRQDGVWKEYSIEDAKKSKGGREDEFLLSQMRSFEDYSMDCENNCQ